MSKITKEEIDYSIQVLMNKLQEEAGKYVAAEMVKRQADSGDIMATLFGGLMEDSTLEPNCNSLTHVIQTLQHISEGLDK